MDKNLKSFITAANKASSNTRWGCYPMAPSIGLTEREISQHQKALEAHGEAYEALLVAGYTEEAELHKKAFDRHSWVTLRIGNYR
jgi:hypothetical protein